MILIQQHYTSPDPVRCQELEHVRRANEASGLFREISAVDGTGSRWSFANLFAHAGRHFAGRTCVIANSDITFDGSLTLAATRVAVPEPVLVALTRWDTSAGPSMEGRLDHESWRLYSHSQDAWVFVAGRLPPFRADFVPGIPRCESRLAYEAAAAGVVVVDPALDVRTMHHHATGVRTWRRRDAYAGPLLFPRLATAEAGEAEALVVVRSPWRTREIPLRLTGDAADFAAQLAAARRPGRSWGLSRLGVRSPVYVRRRSSPR